MRRLGLGGLALSSAVALAMCGTIGLAQQPKDGAAERAGARLDDAARSLRKGFQQAREAVRSRRWIRNTSCRRSRSGLRW